MYDDLDITVGDIIALVNQNFLGVVLAIPLAQGSTCSNVITLSLDDNVPAVVEFFARRLRVVVDPYGDTVSPVSDCSAHLPHDSFHARNLQGGADDNDSVRSLTQVLAAYRTNGFIVRVVFVVQDHARTQHAHTMTSLASQFGTGSVECFASGADGRDRAGEEIWLKVSCLVAFGANHGIETTVKLYSLWPFP